PRQACRPGDADGQRSSRGEGARDHRRKHPLDVRDRLACEVRREGHGERFADLPDFPYPPRYADDLPGYAGLRAHYLDLGPKDAQQTFLCLHGEPDWSYLYRKMIPTFLQSGGRVIAPDFFGFGRSDKPTSLDDYGFHFHRNFLLRLVERLDLRDVTLVAADWGGVIGLTLPVDPGFRARLTRLIVMNTLLATGGPPIEAFLKWREFVRNSPDLAVGESIRRAEPSLSDAEVAAYDAPYPDASYKAGARAFPSLLMVEPDMEGVEESRAAESFWSNDWSGQSFMAVGAQDPSLGVPAMEALRAKIRGCPEPMIVPEAGHFLQEHGQAVAQAALRAFGDL
ncbi:MAG TPA: haloalkane dehalogenase, partial [Pseudonocardia sp.]